MFSSRPTFLLLACLIGYGSSASATPALPLDAAPPQGFFHRAWTERLGAPAEVIEITQTRDGYLWLGTDQGLVRFDGLHFQRVDLFPGDPRRSQALSTLVAMPDDSLWVGLRLGGLVRVRAGRPEYFGPEQGVPDGRAFDAAIDAQGVPWMSTMAGLLRFDGQRWQNMSAVFGFAPETLGALKRTPAGDLFLSVGDDWYLKRAGAERFERQPHLHKASSLMPGRDGALWVAQPDGRLQWLDAAGQVRRTLPAPVGQVYNMREDSRGGFWLGDPGQGLFYYPPSGAAPQRLTAARGLSGNLISAVFEDRDHQVWIGTTLGLDRLSQDRVFLVPHPEGDSGGTAHFAAGGRACISNFFKPLACQDDEQQFRIVRRTHDDKPLYVQTQTTDRRGGLWMAGTDGLWHRDVQGRVLQTPYPDALPRDVMQAMVVDRQQRLWAAPFRSPVIRLQAGRWLPDDPRLPRQGVLSLAADEAGGVWLGTENGELLQWQDEQLQRYGQKDGIPPGRILSLLPAGDALWIGGEQGLLRFAKGRATLVRRLDGAELGRISGLLQTPDGALWLNESSGVIRIAAAARAGLAQTPDQAVPMMHIGQDDGLLGSLPPLRPVNSMSLAPDGQVWVSRAAGIFRFNPAHFDGSARAAPQPMIDTLGDPTPGRVQADGQLTLRYNAVDLVSPARLRFRYRLVGQDSDWVEAGERREARYTNLAPGRYRFELQARSAAGAPWAAAQTTASLELDVPPRWHQRAEVRLAAVLALGVLAWLGWRLWSARALARMQQQLRVQLNERERIARDLHDHLLQGAMGLTLQVQAGIDDLPADHPAGRQLRHALDRADTLLTATRERVQGLRLHQLDRELGPALLDEALEMRGESTDTSIQLQSAGEPRALRPAVCAEVMAVALEAVSNALRHAQAERIELRVDYLARMLEVSVRDEGRGMPEGLDPRTGLAGHWGLRGMHERASLIKSRLLWESRAGHGTTVTLSVPAAQAYQS